jgi:hypothetical protein
MKKVAGTAKAAFGATFGFGVSLVFAATMDDTIYANLRKNLIIPL